VVKYTKICSFLEIEVHLPSNQKRMYYTDVKL